VGVAVAGARWPEATGLHARVPDAEPAGSVSDGALDRGGEPVGPRAIGADKSRGPSDRRVHAHRTIAVVDFTGNTMPQLHRRYDGRFGSSHISVCRVQ